jgi:hypothetical protein
MNNKSEDIEMLLNSIRKRLNDCHEFHIDSEFEVDRKYNKNGMVDSLFYTGKSTYIIKINHNEQYDFKLNN